MYQAFITVSQDLVSHLDKSKRVKLPAKWVLCKIPLLICLRCPYKSSYLKYFVIPSFLANKQNLETLTSVILPSAMCGLFLCNMRHKKRQNYIMWVATPRRLLSTALRINYLCGIILFILSNLILHHTKPCGHWQNELWPQKRKRWNTGFMKSRGLWIRWGMSHSSS